MCIIERTYPICHTEEEVIQEINLIVNLEEKYQIELFPLIIDNKDRPLSELIDLISGLVDNEENNENVEIR